MVEVNRIFGNLLSSDVERRWADLIATEDAAWTTRLSDLRQRLQQEGKLPPTTRD
jgi:muramidase (phage lysozyme)